MTEAASALTQTHFSERLNDPLLFPQNSNCVQWKDTNWIAVQQYAVCLSEWTVGVTHALLSTLWIKASSKDWIFCYAALWFVNYGVPKATGFLCAVQLNTQSSEHLKL